MNLALGIIIGLAVGFVGGYITALYWGKPAREWKKLEQKGIQVYVKARSELDKLK